MKFEIKDSILTKCILEEETSVIIPDGVVEIGAKALYQGYTPAYSIENVYIPDSVQIIGRDAFDRCESLKNVRLPNGLKKIDYGAFRGCRSLEEIDIPDSVNYIGDYAFSRCKKLKEIHIPQGVTRIRSSAFAECDSLKRVILEEGLKAIEHRAFHRCGNLTDIHLPSSLISLSDAFVRCDSLTDINIPSGVAEIPDYCFCSCNSLETVILNEGLQIIGSYAFRNCELKSLEIPDSVTEIGMYAFEECIYLKKVKLPNNLKCIPQGLFNECSSLDDVTIPPNVEIIEFDSFSCTAIKKVHIPASVKVIGWPPYDYTDINNYPVDDIENPFTGCNNLEEISVDSDNEVYYSKCDCIIDKKYRSVVCGCSKSKIPSEVRMIGLGAFLGINNLKHLLIPPGTLAVESFAFAYTNLNEIKFPDTLESIGTDYITTQGALVSYYGNLLDGEILSLFKESDVFVAAPKYDINSIKNNKKGLAIGYGIYSYRTGNQSDFHDNYIQYIKGQINGLIKCAIKYYYPHGMDFIKFLVTNKIVKPKYYKVIDGAVEATNSAEIIASWIEYKMSFLAENPIGALEEGLDDL